MDAPKTHPIVFAVLDLLERNIEPVPDFWMPQAAINRAILHLVDKRLVTLTETGPAITEAGRLCARAVRPN